MPIAVCYLRNKKPIKDELDALAKKWADKINVHIRDISLTAISDFVQAGEQYSAMIHLFLPSLWPEDDIGNIQRTLCEVFREYLNADASEIFILTSIIGSGHVLENGEVAQW